MSAYLGENEVLACYLGDKQVNSAYLNLTLVCSIGVANNTCWTPLTLISGTTYGGTISPTHTSDGTLNYSMQFDTSIGLFIFKFGDTGQTQLEAVNEHLETNTVSLITFTYNSKYEMEMYWDDINLDYRGTDTALANELVLGVDGTVCFGAYVSPDKFLDLDLVTEYVEVV